MQPDAKDMARLWDMLDAAQTAVDFTKGLRYEDLLANRMLRNAVERNLEIIGEAARRISQTTRDNHNELPWKSMIGLRNVLAHEYGEIRYEVVWGVCRNLLPDLIRNLQAMGADNPPGEEA